MLCSGVEIDGPTLKFSDTEIRMVCGDKKLEAYRHIPAMEASLFLQGFLQSRGYLNPEFDKVGDLLKVKVGRRSRVKKIQVITGKRNLNKVMKKEIRRLFMKRILNTTLLNSIEAEALSIARQRGYPCARVKSQVNSLTDTITIVVEQLKLHEFGEFKKEEIEGLRDNALQRYYPFSSHDPFNEELLRLTEKRIVRSEVMPGTYFLESCSENAEEFKLEQKFLEGPPRTIRFGAGASTELGPMARARWNHNRYKSMASMLSATMQASFRNQSLNFTADSYLWKNQPRRSLLSQVEVVRDSQLDYEQTVYRLRSQMKWTFDHSGHFHQYIFGPSFETGTYKTIENQQTKTFSNALLSSDFSWMSHDFELFDIHPQEGDQVGMKMDLRHPAMGFSDPLLKVDSTAAMLGRLSNSGRGTIVGAVRLNAGTSLVSDEVSIKSLPPEVKFFGGGSNDVRGFLLQTLPKNEGVGALSRLGVKLELRRTYVWKESLEIFTFLDQAYFGEKSFKLDSQLWYSPGLGIRWLSPIGLVQTYISRGYVTRPFKDYGYFFYAGLGGVF